MEEDGKARLFRDILQTDLWEPFQKTVARMRELSSSDPVALTLLEVADTVVFDPDKGIFMQVYPDVLSANGNAKETVSIPMYVSELGRLMLEMKKQLD